MRKIRTRQIFENVLVTDAAAKGKSIAKSPDGRVIFLSNAVPGDVVDVEVFKKRKAYYEGKAIQFHSLSEKRTEPVCEHFGVCGGCKWQNMKYEEQLNFKQNEVVNHLKRIGHVEIQEILPIKACDQIYFYRNKMEFSFSDARWLTPQEIAEGGEIDSKFACGFHIPKMWDKILDIEKCHLQVDPSNAIRNEIKRFAIQNGMTFFNPRKQEGFLRTMMIRISSIGEIMVVVQFFNEDKDKREALLNFAAEKFPEITSLQYVINEKGELLFLDKSTLLVSSVLKVHDDCINEIKIIGD